MTITIHGEDITVNNYSYTPTYLISKVKNVANFMTVNNNINIYVNYICEKDNEALYYTSIDNYIDSNNINKSNILKDFDNIEGQCYYFPDVIYECDNDCYFKSYFAFGKIINIEDKSQIPYNFFVNIDSVNRTFEIAPLEKVYNDCITILDDKEIEIDEEAFKDMSNNIESNEFNNADIEIGVGDKEVIQYYFKQYLLNLVYDKENAYNLLDDRYKEKRFGSYKEFEKYYKLQDEEDIEKSILMNYEIKQCTGYTEYLCKDSFENYYIFREFEPMEYSVLLDQYTIDDDIFLEKYNKQDDKGKAQMNLIKFQQMINRKDYSSAYKVLDEGFRSKYFETQESFIDYISKNFNSNYTFDFTKITKEDNDYRIETQVSNTKNRYRDSFVKRFRVKLLNKKSFSISFDI